MRLTQSALLPRSAMLLPASDFNFVISSCTFVVMTFVGCHEGVNGLFETAPFGSALMAADGAYYESSQHIAGQFSQDKAASECAFYGGSRTTKFAADSCFFNTGGGTAPRCRLTSDVPALVGNGYSSLTKFVLVTSAKK
jgi:hypothetical protein